MICRSHFFPQEINYFNKTMIPFLGESYFREIQPSDEVFLKLPVGRACAARRGFTMFLIILVLEATFNQKIRPAHSD
jgi:hypothetical protein